MVLPAIEQARPNNLVETHMPLTGTTPGVKYTVLPSTFTSDVAVFCKSLCNKKTQQFEKPKQKKKKILDENFFFLTQFLFEGFQTIIDCSTTQFRFSSDVIGDKVLFTGNV